MSDPDRIERIGAKVIALWKTQPKERFGQLIFHIGFGSGHEHGFFNFEDEKMETIIDSALRAAGLVPETYTCDDVTKSPPKMSQDEMAAQTPHLGYRRRAEAPTHDYDVVRTDID